MDFVHHSRMVFFAQVNDVHAARSCPNSGALRDRAAGQTFGLKQPENYSFQNLLFSLQVRSFFVFIHDGSLCAFKMCISEAALFC